MQVLVAGGGPAGLMAAATLERRGHDVLVVDRDPGPQGSAWRRRGVMQFDHAHGFRPQVPELLLDEWPAAYDAWLALGAEPVEGAVRSRRSTFERALRRAAGGLPGLTVRCGHVDGLLREDGRIIGASVDGVAVHADLVVDATGRSGRVSGSSDGVAGDCGLAYVDRCYRLLDGAEPGPMSFPLGHVADHDGYQCLLFLHEAGHFSVVLVRPTADPELKALRFEPAFDAACRALPAVSDWVSPARARSTSRVMVGGALRNVYRPQLGVPGLVAVGDSVATTTPTRGRGIAMACLQLRGLLDLLDGGADPVTVAEPFGAWCDQQVQPWVVDHVAIDTGAVRRWQGEEVDLSQPLTTDLVAAAAAADPRIMEHAGGYFSMTALPATLAPAEPLARAVFESGWRPPYAAGPTRDELVAIIDGALRGETTVA